MFEKRRRAGVRGAWIITTRFFVSLMVLHLQCIDGWAEVSSLPLDWRMGRSYGIFVSRYYRLRLSSHPFPSMLFPRCFFASFPRRSISTSLNIPCQMLFVSSVSDRLCLAQHQGLCAVSLRSTSGFLLVLRSSSSLVGMHCC